MAGLPASRVHRKVKRRLRRIDRRLRRLGPVTGMIVAWSMVMAALSLAYLLGNLLWR